MTHTAKFLFTSLFLALAAFSVLPYPADAIIGVNEGLVSCGKSGSGIGNACHLCDLVSGVKTLIDYMRTIMVFISLAVITAMGVLYIVSAGNDGMITMAKSGIKASLIGLAIILSAWLIVNTVIFSVFGAKSDLGVKASFSITGGFSFNCDANLNEPATNVAPVTAAPAAATPVATKVTTPAAAPTVAKPVVAAPAPAATVPAADPPV